MRIETGSMDYQSALRFKNNIMFNHKGSNPRVFKKGRGWAVSYNRLRR